MRNWMSTIMISTQWSNWLVWDVFNYSRDMGGPQSQVRHDVTHQTQGTEYEVWLLCQQVESNHEAASLMHGYYDSRSQVQWGGHF